MAETAVAGRLSGALNRILAGDCIEMAAFAGGGRQVTKAEAVLR